MLLNISPTRLITDVQKEFNTEFPFLKLEFFKKNHWSVPMQKRIASGRQMLSEIQWPLVGADVEIKEDMKVNDLEKIFKKDLGLNVQVFRKSGNLWLETTMTDNWTLAMQNVHGKEISTSPVKKIEEFDDYDLSRDASH
jgi:hypothetical protein